MPAKVLRASRSSPTSATKRARKRWSNCSSPPAKETARST